MASGAGSYFDGTTSTRRTVTVETGPTALIIRTPDDTPIAEWPYPELSVSHASHDVLRVGRINSVVTARIEVRDTSLIAEIDRLADSIDRTGKTERRMRQRVVFWSLAATVSLVLIAIYGMPMLADRIAPLIPLSLERRFGTAIEAQMRSILDQCRDSRRFKCGAADNERVGQAAFDKLLTRLEQHAGLPIRISAAVVRRGEANAIALPGGYIYVFEGLLRQSRNPDELAGVIAHEIGHIAHRDSTRVLLQSAGLSFLFGMMLGDFTGGGVVVIAARTMMQSAYTREVEAAADSFGVQLMVKSGGNPRALAAILDRIAGAIEPGVKIFLDHPQTKDRVAAINVAAASAKFDTRPLLSEAEWSSLKAICG